MLWLIDTHLISPWGLGFVCLRKLMFSFLVCCVCVSEGGVLRGEYVLSWSVYGGQKATWWTLFSPSPLREYWGSNPGHRFAQQILYLEGHLAYSVLDFLQCASDVPLCRVFVLLLLLFDFNYSAWCSVWASWICSLASAFNFWENLSH